MLAALHRMLGRLLVLSVPTAAAINGHAFGAGAMLSAACDYRVMRSDRGYFCFPEVDVGLTMSDGFNALLQSKFPKDSLHLAWTTGTRYPSEEARRLGFVHETVSEERVVGAAGDFLRPSSGKDPGTLSALKRQLHDRAASILLAD
jgi:enoyl-CoA hydratase/carnithine racemase